MKNITEQLILSLAPNPAAASNGKKISAGGGFVKLYRAADDSFFMGECKGSGKNPYITSADYVNEEHPVFRCSCPSRQFPCKHSLGLLFEMMSEKTFEICEIPEDIRKKREKLAARSEKAAEKSPEEMTPEEAEKLEKKKASAARSARSAKKKKLQKQLEGLELAEKAVKELVSAGLGTMGGASLSIYTQLSKQLGDYYLIGPQRLLNRLIIEITAFQTDNLEEHYDNAIDTLEKLHSLIKKSRQYINEKLENDNVANDDTILYEELGGAWKLSELEAIGKCRKDAQLAQISFWVEFDEARKEYVDTGCWCDLGSGEIFLTKNYRPLKSLKYVKQADSLFGVVTTPLAAVYPGEINPRIRWDSAEIRGLTAEDCEKIRSFAAKSISAEAKSIKNKLQNAMASPVLYKLISFSKIGKIGDGIVLKSESGDTILLEDFPELEKTTERTEILPNKALYENGTALCGFWYNAAKRRLSAQPLCIIPNNETAVVRLLY